MCALLHILYMNTHYSTQNRAETTHRFFLRHTKPKVVQHELIFLPQYNDSLEDFQITIKKKTFQKYQTINGTTMW